MPARTKPLSERDLELGEEESKSRAQENFRSFTAYTYPKYRFNWHHKVIGRKLERFIRGEIKRLIIVAPPRTGKTELVSRRMPAYIFGVKPDAKIISTSYSAKLATRLNRDVQRIMLHPLYGELFPETRLSAKRVATATEGKALRNAGEFEIVGRLGYYMCAGVGGGVTGYGADYILVDDPFKNRKEANSKTTRDRVWDWFRDDLSTRLDGDGGILITVTRWHEDDLVGRLLAEQRADTDDEAEENPERWEILHLPAELEEQDQATKDQEDPREVGDVLWPWLWAGKRDDLSEEEQVKKSRARLHRIKRKNPYGYSALYQGRPTPKSGEFFQPDKIQIVRSTPCRRLKQIRYWDKAGTEGGGAFTAGVKMSKLEDGRFLIDHVVRGQWAAPGREKKMKDMAEIDGKKCTIMIEREGGSGGKESADNTIKNLAGYVIRSERPTGSKEVRAEAFSVQVEGGQVLMIKGDWNHDYVEELRHFPGGPYKDQVDASSGAFNNLTKVKDIRDLNKR